MSDDGDATVDLTDLALFDGVEADDVSRLAGALELHRVAAGDVLMAEGDPAGTFAIVATGDATVRRDEDAPTVELARLGRGDIVGELGLLTGGRRTSTVAALTDVELLVGGLEAFESMLDVRVVHDRIQRIVSRRLAENARPVEMTLRDGTSVLLRPLLPTDRDEHHQAVREASAETLRLRFFTSAVPSRRTLDYLVDIDYVDHYAWVCTTRTGDGVGIVRYVRLHGEHDEAEVAFATQEGWRRRGVASRMLGAIAIAAQSAGIDELLGYYLADNHGSHALFEKARAAFRVSEPGVVEARVAAGEAASLLAPNDADALRDTVADIVTAAGLALTDAGRHPDRLDPTRDVT